MTVKELLRKLNLKISTFKLRAYIFTLREDFLVSFGETELQDFELYNDPDGSVVLEILE